MKPLHAHLVFALFLAANSCVASSRSPVPGTAAIPQALSGEFIDDYGIEYIIDPSLWFQRPRARYHIVRTDTLAMYLIARNDEGNPGEPGRWTRIDWITLDGMAPYTWAFCLSAYDAPTMAAAETVTVARRDTPRTGCNGHPFSRMRRRPP